MTKHIFLPYIDLDTLEIVEPYKSWLSEWLEEIEEYIESCNIASSICLQAILAEKVLHKTLKHQWLEIFEDCLTSPDGKPLAYSEFYGKRLHKYDQQWVQTPVHSIYTLWWIQNLVNNQADNQLTQLIEDNIQRNGWIYNLNVSSTQHLRRMKSEYQMSMAMGTEILGCAGLLNTYKEIFESVISNEECCPYLSAEYFRLRALENLKAPHLAPEELCGIIEPSQAGEGYCDYSMKDKRDDYMGTAKRSSSDETVHSPLATLHALYISTYCEEKNYNQVILKVKNFANHLNNNPLDIPAFKVRDLVDIPFGTGISPLEMIATSYIITNFNK